MRFFGSWQSLSTRVLDPERTNGITDSVRGIRRSRDGALPRLSQPRLFMNLVEVRARLGQASLLAAFGESRKSDDPPPAVWSLATTPEKEFLKTVVMGEQTFADRKLGSKMIPGFPP